MWVCESMSGSVPVSMSMSVSEFVSVNARVRVHLRVVVGVLSVNITICCETTFKHEHALCITTGGANRCPFERLGRCFRLEHVK